MSQTQANDIMRSRPLYGRLVPRQGSSHFIVADGEGGEAVAALLTAAPDLKSTTHIVYIPGTNGTDLTTMVSELGAQVFHAAPSYASASQRIRKVLGDAHMGLQLYAAGTEGLIGQVQRDAIAAGLPHDALQTEQRGSLARRVQCVHCKGITENVTLDPFVCSHCGLNLFVRDHYSRRLAAFQGVCIDAEDPGEVPASEERFK
ncbi:dimethylamine monooxygenase subunit DmmA family protein [Gemmobacter sp. 24YEA27]|uniref:dimethylamine monooxygenase subunit DmmA family protein n=1 Tax=Gemmobacter sp. 24YEA27 TaxID=3040672 RepID=UPI0024B38E3C|nr:dimethylamine monooxygenase subunit DmmA family protein [Gemmobacter sp. 24YEA27]